MKWEHLLSKARFKIGKNGVEPSITQASVEGSKVKRSDFMIDYDRLVFSTSFRRLGRKTQVHPFSEKAHIHNRLTHILEVASVGRSMGNQLGVMLESELPLGVEPDDIGSVVQVACLAHDLGNPPFGHAGEEAIQEWFAVEGIPYLKDLSREEKCDVMTYEGNAHTMRLVANLEMYRHNGGMRLTAASLGTLMKYPWQSLNAPFGKFNLYQTELPLLERVCETLGLKRLNNKHFARHPLSYLMEAADDICYALLDLEDAIDLGVLEVEDVQEVLNPIVSETMRQEDLSPLQYCRRLRGKAIGNAISDVVQTFVKYKKEILQGEFPAKDLLALSSSSLSEAIHNAKKIARDKIFINTFKLNTEIASFPCLGSILRLLIPATYRFIQGTDKKLVSDRYALCLLKEEPIQKTDSLYIAYMKVLDFVGALTDDEAARLAREVSGIGIIH